MIIYWLFHFKITFSFQKFPGFLIGFLFLSVSFLQFHFKMSIRILSTEVLRCLILCWFCRLPYLVHCFLATVLFWSLSSFFFFWTLLISVYIRECSKIWSRMIFTIADNFSLLLKGTDFCANFSLRVHRTYKWHSFQGVHFFSPRILVKGNKHFPTHLRLVEFYSETILSIER